MRPVRPAGEAPHVGLDLQEFDLPGRRARRARDHDERMKVRDAARLRLSGVATSAGPVGHRAYARPRVTRKAFPHDRARV